MRIDDLMQGEVSALDVFKKRLETIRDLQAQRKEQGGGVPRKKRLFDGRSRNLKFMPILKNFAVMCCIIRQTVLK